MAPPSFGALLRPYLPPPGAGGMVGYFRGTGTFKFTMKMHWFFLRFQFVGRGMTQVCFRICIVFYTSGFDACKAFFTYVVWQHVLRQNKLVQTSEIVILEQLEWPSSAPPAGADVDLARVHHDLAGAGRGRDPTYPPSCACHA